MKIDALTPLGGWKRKGVLLPLLLLVPNKRAVAVGSFVASEQQAGRCV